MTNRRRSAAAVLVTSVLASASAHADEPPAAFGAGSPLVLAAERLFGYVHTSQTRTLVFNGMEQTTTINSFAVFSSPLSVATAYSAPRLALDYFVTDHLSLGLAASYFKVTQEIQTVMNAFEPTYSGFFLAPRAGYGLPLSPFVTLWPRFGLTIMHLTLESTVGGIDTVTTNGTTLYALTAEIPLVVTIAPHLFVALGPTLDLGVGGSTDDTSPDGGVDTRATSFGLQFALGGYF